MEKVLKCGFGVTKTFEGQKGFDTDYIDREIVKKVRKVGDGDEDFIIEEVEIEHKRPIKETIQAQAVDSGINAYLKPFIMSGQPLPEVIVSDKIDDFSDMPEDLAGASDLGQSMVEAFSKVDPRLRGSSSSVEEFLSSLTKEKMEAYIREVVGVVKTPQEGEK